MTIFLCGMMGSGKSTVGRRLAALTGRPFVDLDEEVAREAGMEIPDIFAREGEAAFRARELAALERATGEGEAVIALGGGAPCREEVMSLIARTGTMAYLRVSAGTAAARLAADSRRPLLPRGADGKVSAVGIDRLIAEREAWYLRAGLVIDADGRTPDDIAGEILGRLAEERP